MRTTVGHNLRQTNGSRTKLIAGLRPLRITHDNLSLRLSFLCALGLFVFRSCPKSSDCNFVLCFLFFTYTRSLYLRMPLPSSTLLSRRVAAKSLCFVHYLKTMPAAVKQPPIHPIYKCSSTHPHRNHPPPPHLSHRPAAKGLNGGGLPPGGNGKGTLPPNSLLSCGRCKNPPPPYPRSEYLAYAKNKTKESGGEEEKDKKKDKATDFALLFCQNSRGSSLCLGLSLFVLHVSHLNKKRCLADLHIALPSLIFMCSGCVNEWRGEPRDLTPTFINGLLPTAKKAQKESVTQA